MDPGSPSCSLESLYRECMEAAAGRVSVPPGSPGYNHGLLDTGRPPKALREAYRAHSGDPGTERFLRDPASVLPTGPDDREGAWRWACLTAHSRGQEPDTSDAPAEPMCEVNSAWGRTEGDILGVRLENGAPTRPEGGAIFDFVSEDGGYRMLEEAHSLAHSLASGMVLSGRRPGDRGWLSRTFLQCAARWAVASKLGIPPMELPPWIQVSASSSFMRPDGVLQIDEWPGPDVLAVVFCGVRIEPHPRSMSKSSQSAGWLEVNRWSCMPSMVSVAGFQFPEFVLKQKIGRRGSLVVPLKSMLPAGLLPDLVSLGLDCMPAPDAGPKQVPRVPLPCMECLRLNRRADGVPETPETMARFEDEAYALVDRAAEYCEGLAAGHTAAKRARKAARSAWARREKSLAQASRLLARSRKWLEKGDSEKASALRAKALEITRQFAL